jgi:hypothetical protein
LHLICPELAALSIGGYIANSVQTLFVEFDDKASRFPYYSMMYYEGMGLAVYGSLGVIMIIVYVAAQRHSDTASVFEQSLSERSNFLAREKD